MEQLEFVLWVIGGAFSINILIQSAIWREVKDTRKKVDKIGEENAGFKVRLTVLERNKHECRFASK